MLAAMFNRTAIVDLLLARGADRTAVDAGGQTAAELAAEMNAPDTPRQLPARSN